MEHATPQAISPHDLTAGEEVMLSVGPHSRPLRFCGLLSDGQLAKFEARADVRVSSTRKAADGSTGQRFALFYVPTGLLCISYVISLLPDGSMIDVTGRPVTISSRLSGPVN